MLDHEAQIAANNTLKWEAADAAWATRARDPADLLLLAEIAYDQFFDLRAFPSLPAGFEESDDQQKIAVACLIRGIADVARAQAPPCPRRGRTRQRHAGASSGLAAAVPPGSPRLRVQRPRPDVRAAIWAWAMLDLREVRAAGRRDAR